MSEAHDIPAASAPEAGAAPNVRLSQARQARNLTTADVARHLKLSVWQVEALESGRYQQLPGPIFVRGFIRNYARLVKLDPEELVQAVSGLLPHAALPPEGSPSRDIPFPAGGTRRWPKYAAAAVVIVGVLAAYEFYFNEERATVKTRPGPVAAAPARKEAPPAAPARKDREASPKPAPAAPAPAQQVAASAPAAASASATPPRERVAHPDDREVSFVFEEDSWVEIRDRNDQTIFSQLNRAGTSRRVSGLPPLYIVVGNSQGVRMTYAGREIDLARHTKIDVARLTLQ
jgi:cytoskeleton protein RodZ